MQQTYDVVIIGAGIAGASLAFELVGQAKVLLVERESMPGYHSTGRSAALFTETYGNSDIRLLTMASRQFFEAPPDSFSDNQLLAPRGVLWVGRSDQHDSISRSLHAVSDVCPVAYLNPDEACAVCSALREDYVAEALFEHAAMDIDVAATHQGFLRGFRRKGGEVRVNAEVRKIKRRDAAWQLFFAGDEVAAGTVVNAAGGWCDEIAELADVRPIGLVPKRRTAFTFPEPDGMKSRNWPVVMDIDEKFYFKPEAGRLLGSPADEEPVAPSDVQAEELDVAEAVDRIERATRLSIRRIERRWAGLRSFVGDGSPVVGEDPDAPGFFWLAGQGGYGVMTAPAMARLACSLMLTRTIPTDLANRGLNETTIGISRLRIA